MLFSDFKLDNDTFKNGLSKIAYSFAIYSGIPIENISSFINISLSEGTGELQNITFNTQIIPFVALNDFDKSIEFSELNNEFPPFHNIVLFRYRTQLWCFINLFDTFQWYVKISDVFHADSELECEVINSLFQFIQSRQHETEDKKTANTKKTPELNTLDSFLFKKIDKFAKQDAITDFYLDPHNGGFTNRYHLICASTDVEHSRLFGLFYPTCIQNIQNDIYSNIHMIIRAYTVKKFQRLSCYSNLSKPTLSPEFLNSLSENDLEKFNILYKQSCVSNRVSKQIDLNILFPDTTDIHTEEETIVDTINSNVTALIFQYDRNVNISFINRNIGPSSFDSLINKIASEWNTK